MNNRELMENIIRNIELAIVGKHETVEFAMLAFIAGGHLLLEDVPGVGKTTLAKAIARSIDCDFSRIQFTPDTLPSDVTGLSVYNMATGKFEFSRGAVMSNLILADEINRTSPKTQSSLLEAMEEGQVSVDGTTYPLPDPFMVIATQNPVDTLGTFHLPEAQLDRFMMKLSIGYPAEEDELQMIDRMLKETTVATLKPVAKAEDIVRIRQDVQKIFVHEDIRKYIMTIVTKTRNSLMLSLGASPRATKALVRAAQAYALLQGRDFVIPEDVIHVMPKVLPHRLILSAEGRIGGTDAAKVLDGLIRETKVPVISQ